jgi:hypothetical protein
MSITDFLLARIAEDEEVAHHARGLLGMEAEWHTVEHLRGRGLTVADARHVERWSSARALVECDAKRRIVEEHTGESIGDPMCRHLAAEPCATLRSLTLPYADHPDYDEAWRP